MTIAALAIYLLLGAISVSIVWLAIAGYRADRLKRRMRIFAPTDRTRMDAQWIADLKAEAERNAGDPYPRPVPDYCDVAYGEDGNPKLTVRQRAALRTVK